MYYVVLDDEDTFCPLGKHTTVVQFTDDDFDTVIPDEDGLTVKETLNNGDMRHAIEYASEEIRIDRLVDFYLWCRENVEKLSPETAKQFDKVK